MCAAGTCAASDDDHGLRRLSSLLECLEGLPDPQRRHGMRHRATVAVAAVMVGADSVAAVAECAHNVPAEVLDAFDAPVAGGDGEALAAAFGTWLATQVLAGLADAAAVVIAGRQEGDCTGIPPRSAASRPARHNRTSQDARTEN